jgi:hypothetical protein
MNVVREYLAALDASDAEAMLGLFHPSGEVLSPFLGRMGAHSFFTKLTQSSLASDIDVFDVLPSLSAPRVAAYFHYRWTLLDGSIVEFDCCDIYDFVTDSESPAARPLIKTMTIVYDTAPIRAEVGDKYA